MKTYKYIILLTILLLSACTQDNDWLNENTVSSSQGTVCLNLQSAEIEVTTRSTTPQDPQTDNPMYDLFLLHYSFEGQLIETASISFEQAQLNYKWNPTLTIDAENRKETLCLVANMKGHHPQWPTRLADFKEACVDLQIGSNGLIEPKKMYMFGYYEGVIEANKEINIMMGRMAAAVKFVITASKASNASPYQINSIEIIKASRQTHFFPNNSTDENFGSSIKEAFTSNNLINNDKNDKNDKLTELVYYYQIGENISPSELNRTKVKINATYNGKARDYTVVLGCDAPGTPNRNYSLYRNNNYTFNINLK